jgi:hypothetical protein
MGWHYRTKGKPALPKKPAYSSAIRVCEGAKNAPAFLWWGAKPDCFRDANPGCGFLPQHENDTQPGMECQDAVADDSKRKELR